MVVFEVVAAGGGNSVELVVFEVGEFAARGLQGATEFIVRPVHLVYLHDGSQTAFVEHLVVCHERKTINQRFNSRPYRWEQIGIVGILVSKAVHPLAEPFVVIWLRSDEAVEAVCHHTITDDDNADAAHAATALVGCLKIYGCKVVHVIFLLEIFVASKAKQPPAVLLMRTTGFRSAKIQHRFVILCHRTFLFVDSVSTEILSLAFGTVVSLPHAIKMVGGSIH